MAWAEALRRAAWPLLALVLLLGALGLRGTTTNRWDWQPALAGSEPWRAFTAAWVHWSPQHLVMNATALGLVAWLGWRAGAGPRDALAWGLAWPMTQAGLVLQPALQHYGGLSGVLHAGATVLAWRLLRGPAGRPRQIGALLAAGLVLKLLSEAPWRGATQAVVGWDFALAPMAHVSGAASGLLCALLLDLASRPARA